MSLMRYNNNNNNNRLIFNKTQLYSKRIQFYNRTKNIDQNRRVSNNIVCRRNYYFFHII